MHDSSTTTEVEFILGSSAMGFYSALDRITLSDLECGLIPSLTSHGYSIDICQVNSTYIHDSAINLGWSGLILKFVRSEDEANSAYLEPTLVEVSEWNDQLKVTIPCEDVEHEAYFLLQYKDDIKVKLNLTLLERIVIRQALFSITHFKLLISNNTLHRERREWMSHFYLAVAGKRRDKVSNRLRWAAQLLVKEPHAAINILFEAAIIAFRLPEVAQNALLLPSNYSYHRQELRELCYFARAGISGLRAICAYKLKYLQLGDAETSLLAELAYDPDPWVRTAAGAPMVQ